MNFFDVIFKAPQGRVFPFINHHAVSEKSQVLSALNFAIRYITAGDIADFRDLENFANLSRAQDPFFKRGSHHSDHRVFNVIDNIINNIVKAHIHLFIGGQGLDLWAGSNVKADYNGI